MKWWQQQEKQVIGNIIEVALRVKTEPDFPILLSRSLALAQSLILFLSIFPFFLLTRSSLCISLFWIHFSCIPRMSESKCHLPLISIAIFQYFFSRTCTTKV